MTLMDAACHTWASVVCQAGRAQLAGLPIHCRLSAALVVRRPTTGIKQLKVLTNPKP